MVLNKQAQTGIVSVIFGLIMFFIIYALWGAKFIQDWVNQAIVTGNFGPIESFLLANMNLWIILFLILGVIGVAYYGGSQ